MDEVVVVSSYLPGETPWLSRQYPTNAVCCVDAWDYWRGLAAWWASPHIIVNIERDMEASDDLVADLLQCPRPLCTHAYLIHEAGHENVPFYAHMHQFSWVPAGTEQAEFSGIGFAKITPAARDVPTLRQADWSTLELAVNGSVVQPWHVHWPEIDHYHRTEARESRPAKGLGGSTD